MESIKSHRILLRTPKISDAKTLLDYLQEPKIKKLISLPKTVSKLEEYLKKGNTKTTMRRTMVLLENKKAIGSVVLREISRKHRRADLGYRIWETYEWKWYMTEILKTFLIYLFEDEKFERIQARVKTDNIASIKVLEKIWFVYEGKARNFAKKGWVRHDFLLYGMIQQDYNKIKITNTYN